MRLLLRPLGALMIAATAFSFSSCSSSKPAPRKTYSSAPRVAFKPLVTIRNTSYKNIVLGLRGPETRFVSLPARGSKTVSLSSGAYKYAATARNTNTISGYKYFGRNSRYTWNFKIN